MKLELTKEEKELMRLKIALALAYAQLFGDCVFAEDNAKEVLIDYDLVSKNTGKLKIKKLEKLTKIYYQ